MHAGHPGSFEDDVGLPHDGRCDVSWSIHVVTSTIDVY